MLAFLVAVATANSGKFCFYNFYNGSCPTDSTEKFSVHDWAIWHAREEVAFGLTGNVTITFYLTTDILASNPISLRIPQLGVHNVTFKAIIDDFGFQRRVTLDFPTVTAATYYEFIGCEIVVPGTEAVAFSNLILENSSFVEDTERVYAEHTLTVDLYSASRIRFLAANRTVLNFDKSYWPYTSEVISIGKIIPVRLVIIGGIDHSLSLRIFGDLFLFERPGYNAVVYVDVTESITPPRIELDKRGGQLVVYAEYYVPKYYDPPIVEFRLETNEPLIFEDSPWPFWLPNLVRVTTRGRAGQNLWIRTPRMPVTIQTWWNISDTWKPLGSKDLTGGYLTELTIFADRPNVEILGRIQTQASDLHFDTHLHEKVNLVIFDLVEYGMIDPASPSRDIGIFPHIGSANMSVRIFGHEKHENLNTASKFGGPGKWEWEYFPYCEGSTGVGNLLVDGDHIYDLFYGHNHTYGLLAAPLTELDPEKEQLSTVTFLNPDNKVLQIRPLYYFQEFNRPSDNELEANWPASSGSSPLIYFRNVQEDFQVKIHYPETGASGFEPSTYFFDFVWDHANKAVWFNKKDVHVNNFNYKFCYVVPSTNASHCPANFRVIEDPQQVKSYVKPIAKQLRFAILSSFNFCPIFDWFTNTSIDITVFSPYHLARPEFLVPVEFLHGPKFGETHLFNITLAFNESRSRPVNLSNVVHLDLHNVSFSPYVLNDLALGGCAGTPRLEADPISYAALRDRCIPDVLFLDEGKFNTITFSNDSIVLSGGFQVGSEEPPSLTIALHAGRPEWVEIIYHNLTLQINAAARTTHIPRTTIFQPDIPGEPQYTFNANWQPLIAGNLTIDNLFGYFYINTPFVPFRPGFLVRVPFTGPGGIRIHRAGNQEYPNGVRVYYPFPDYARVNPGSWGELLRYEEATFVQPMSLDGDIDRAIFAGSVTFELGAGINVHNATFDKANLPTFIVHFRLQGGLPRIYLGTSYAPMDLPHALYLRHDGPSEKAFIQRHPDWFRRFSHEIICSNASWPCEHWPVYFDRQNTTQDPTADHVSGSSILRPVCRQENEGVHRVCLALEIDEFYFPLPTASRFATPIPWPTFPPPPTIVPTHSPYQTGHEPRATASRSSVKPRTFRTATPSITATPHPPDAGGGGKVTEAAPSKMGKGVGIGIGVGLAIAIVAGILVYFLFIRPKPKYDGYDNADLDARLGVSL